MSEVKTAIVKSTFLGVEDHGIFTAILQLDCSDGRGYIFGTHDLHFAKYGIAYLEGILNVFNIDSWEKLIGKPLRVEVNRNKVNAIGHFINNKWFNPEVELAGLEDEHD
jgi:hypothetical protein